ncbi:MAG: hypothetical protein V2B20_12400 [Pseudomonadota bacterium]
MSGYGVIRSCCSGYKIGPLYAESSDLAEHNNMQVVFETARMYTGK